MLIFTLLKSLTLSERYKNILLHRYCYVTSCAMFDELPVVNKSLYTYICMYQVVCVCVCQTIPFCFRR